MCSTVVAVQAGVQGPDAHLGVRQQGAVWEAPGALPAARPGGCGAMVSALDALLCPGLLPACWWGPFPAAGLPERLAHTPCVPEPPREDGQHGCRE
jgi:hypothetical protein